MRKLVGAVGVALFGALSPCALSSVDFEMAIANDVSTSAIEGMEFDAEADCREQLSRRTRSEAEVGRELPRCVAFANEQVAELNDPPDTRFERLKSRYPAHVATLIDGALSRGEMDVSCLEYEHYSALFSACRNDSRRGYLARVAAPDYVPVSCSQLAIHRKLKTDSMTSMDYVASWRAHTAMFVGEVVAFQNNQLTLNFGGRDALVEILPSTHSYRRDHLSVGAEVVGYGTARRTGVTVSRRNGQPVTVAVIDASCIQ